MSTPSLEALLRDRFGFDAFRPGQRAVVDALRTHGRALAVFPTGAGKSLCYQLPALTYEGATIVVSPLIALMKDQIDFLRGRGIEAARLDSSLGADEAREVSAKLQDGTLKLLYVAPERFNNERFLAQLGRTRISLFVVDEAHCISEWGHNFRPDYLKLARTAQALGAERILALTATATPAVVESICAAFGIPAEAAVVTGFYRPNLRMLVTPVSARERDAVLLDRLRTRAPGPTIVYVTLQKTAEHVAEVLSSAGLEARAYHAGLDAEARHGVQEWWMESDRRIVAATIAFGMGIDKADVRYVYHYNLPKSLESYSQEIGRAGRDGAPSTVELLACADDVPVLENFAYGDTPAEASVRSLVEELLGAGDSFDVSQYQLANRHDLRPLVLKTALTYLELLGVLRQETPFYAGYELRPELPIEEIVGRFEGERAQFVASLFRHAKKGRIWHSLNPDEAAKALGEDRERITRALEYLGEKGWVVLRASDLRQRYARVSRKESVDALVRELCGRFRTREERELERLHRMLALVTHDGCLVNELVGYFGEVREAPCGHCSFCETGRAQALPEASRERASRPAGLDLAGLNALRAEHPAALGEPRQAARFLCGLSSPALTRAKLSRHPWFGALEDRRFADVLGWLEKA